jgi:hypothetical protein
MESGKRRGRRIVEVLFDRGTSIGLTYVYGKPDPMSPKAGSGTQTPSTVQPLFVDSVVPNSQAAKKGVQPGDKVLLVNGRPVIPLDSGQCLSLDDILDFERRFAAAAPSDKQQPASASISSADIDGSDAALPPHVMYKFSRRKHGSGGSETPYTPTAAVTTSDTANSLAQSGTIHLVLSYPNVDARVVIMMHYLQFVTLPILIDVVCSGSITSADAIRNFCRSHVASAVTAEAAACQ